MKKIFKNAPIYVAIMLLNLIVNCEISNAQVPVWQWAKKMGNVTNDKGTSIAVDSIGNVYTLGNFTGTVDFNPGSGMFNLTSNGNGDFFISKLDSSGNFIWAKSIGGSHDDFGYSIALDDTGNFYITGMFYDTVDFDPGAGIYNISGSLSNNCTFIAKYNSTGNIIWAKAIGGTGSCISFDLALDLNGNILTTGIYYNTCDFDPDTSAFNLTALGSPDLFILKLDNSGNFIWAKVLGATGVSTEGRSLAIDARNNVYTTGLFNGAVDFDPGLGTFNLVTIGWADIFILKLDSNGNFVWANQFGDTYYDAGTSIAIDPLGNVYTGGGFRGTVDFDPGNGVFNIIGSIGVEEMFISKLDSSGNFIWAKAIGKTASYVSYTIGIDPVGNIFSTGKFTGMADFDPGPGFFYLTDHGGLILSQDIFISKLDSGGNFIWAMSLGEMEDDFGSAIAFDHKSNLLITGYFNCSAIAFGNTILTNSVSTGTTGDIFIAKLDSDITSGIEVFANTNGVSVYPNPANDYLSIAFETRNIKFDVSIADIAGKIIYTTTSNNSQKLDVNTTDFASGVYLVHVRTRDFIETRKLIVAK